MAVRISGYMNKNTSDPRLILKATAPRASRSLLYRDRLGLNRGSQRGRIFIALQAPAGYGKTSLLLQWRREALESGAIVAWLTLDEHDDPTCFARGLGAALSIGSGSGKFVHESRSSSARHEGELESLTIWLAEVASMAVDVELILDDVHTLPTATVETALMYLLLNAPANLRIILAYRRSLALNFAELIASGRLLHLQGDELCFTLEETAEALEASLNARVEKDTCVRLYELTEGWPLGVQLAMSSMMKRAKPHDAVAELSSRSGDLQHYFMEVLVDRLEPDEAMFLTNISCLDRVQPELCQWMTKRKDSGKMLTHLRNNTPVFQDAVSGDWMRIHPIAREFLHDRFERLPKAHRRQLHTRAARWLAEHEMYEEAAQHARLAGNDEFAFDLIERCIHGIVAQGRVSQVLDWLEHLPASEIQRRPQIRLAIGWALAQSERQRAAAELVAPILDDPEADATDRCEAAEICATAAFFTDDFDALLEIITPWRQSLVEQPALQQIAGGNILAVIELFQGKPENANYQLQRLRDIPHTADLSYPLGWLDWISGFTYLWEGQVDLADKVLRAALSRAEATSGRRSPIAVMLAATLAAVLWERELFDEAGMLLADRLDVLERHAPPDAIIHGYVTAARLAAMAGSQSKAHDLIEQLRAIGDTRDLPRLCIASLAEEVRMLALRQQESACLARLARLEKLEQSEASRWGILQPIVAPQIAIARAYAAITSYHWESVLPILEAADIQVKQARRVRDAIQVQLLRGLAIEHRGEDATALFDEAASLAKSLGLGRVIGDTYPTLVGRDSSGEAGVASSGKDDPHSIKPSEVVRAPAQPRVVANALLTPKETEVLQLLAGNLSNKKIALALGVGDQTVKWHLKNMFHKLQAGTRQHLLARARMLGILE